MVNEVVLVTQPCSTLQPHRLQPTRILCRWDSPGKNTVIGCHFLLQGIFPTLHCRQDSLPSELQESPNEIHTPQKLILRITQHTTQKIALLLLFRDTRGDSSPKFTDMWVCTWKFSHPFLQGSLLHRQVDSNRPLGPNLMYILNADGSLRILRLGWGLWGTC